MITPRNRRIIYNIAMVSLILCFVAVIPFSSKTVKFFEIIFKLLILPAVILILNIIISSKKYEAYRPTDRFTSFVSYVPALSYLLSITVYTVFLIGRANPIEVLSFNKLLYSMIFLGLTLIGLVFVLFLVDRIALKKTKFGVNVFDIFVLVAFVVDILIIRSSVFNKYQNISLVNHSGVNVISCIVVTLIFLVAVFFRMRFLFISKEEFVQVDKEKLIEEWSLQRVNSYFDAELKILYSMLNYTGERLSVDVFKEEAKAVDPELANKVQSLNEKLAKAKEHLKTARENEALEARKNQQIVEAYKVLKNQVQIELAKSELEAIKKQLEIVLSHVNGEKAEYETDLAVYESEKADLEAKVQALEAEKNELAAEAEAEAPVTKSEPRSTEQVKKEKVFAYAYEDLVAYAQSFEQEELNVLANPKGNQHKFMIGKKPYLVTQKTSSDYRVTFVSPDDKLIQYLQGYPGIISVANSPKGGNWLKVINKGELTKEFVETLAKESLEAFLSAEQAAFEAKEAERRAKEAERRAKEEAERAAKAQELAEKEQELLAKEAELQATAEEEEAKRKALEEENARKTKEAEKQAEKLVRDAEKEAAKKAKEAEKLLNEAKKQSNKKSDQSEDKKVA